MVENKSIPIKINERTLKINKELFTPEEIENIKKYIKNIDIYFKRHMTGGQWRDKATLSGSDSIAINDIYQLLHLINQRDQFTEMDIFDVRMEYNRTGKFGPKMKEIWKDWQVKMSEVLKESGENLNRNTDPSEIKKLNDILKAAGYNGTALEAESEGKMGRVNINDAKFELKVDKSGRGNLIIYEKVSVKGEDGKWTKSEDFVKTREISFDLKNKDYNTKIFHIYADGIPGEDSTLGLTYIFNQATQAPVSMEVVQLGHRFDQIYDDAGNDGNTKKLREKFGSDTINDLYNKINQMTSENIKQMSYGNAKDYSKLHEMILGDTINITEIENNLKKFTENKKEHEKGFYSIENTNSKTKNFELDLTLINRDYDEMKKIVRMNITDEKMQNKYNALIDGYQKEVIDGITKIKNESENYGDFNKKLNESKLLTTHNAVSRILNRPLLPNYFTLKQYQKDYYSQHNGDKVVVEEAIKKTAESLGKDKEELEETINKYLVGEKNYLDLSQFKEKNPNLYYEFMLHFIKEDITTIIANTEAKKTEKIEATKENIKDDLSTKKEDKVEKPAILKGTPIKSPTEDELNTLASNLKNSSAFTRIFQEETNKELRKAGGAKSDLLVVDGDFGKLSERMLRDFDYGTSFWRNLQNHKENQKIMEKVGENMWENRNTSSRGKKEFQNFISYVKKNADIFGYKKEYDFKTQKGFNDAWKDFRFSYIEQKDLTLGKRDTKKVTN